MAAGKEEKKEEKGKEKTEEKKEKKEEKDEKDKAKDEKKEGSDMITAIYKVNLHCQECGRKIKRHLLVTEGVQNVETDIEKGELKVKGKLDPLKILKLIQKKSKKKVELISPKIKVQDTPTPAEKKPKETKKEPIIRTITVKVHMHCDKCERDLRNRLIKHKGIFSVKTDQKAQTVATEGSIEPEKLLKFLKRRVHKNAEIISSKEEKKGDEKGKGKEEKKGDEKEKGKEEKKGDEKEKGKDEKKGDEKGKGKEEKKGDEKEKGKKDEKSLESTKEKEGKGGESTKEKGEGKSSSESTKEKEKEKGKGSESEKEKVGSKPSGETTTQIIEIQGDTKVEIVVKDNVPYIIHYVYAPQLFSDENPNACCIS